MTLKHHQLMMSAGGDPFFSNVVFLLDTSGSSVADKSGYASTVTDSANAPTISTAQSKWSGRSALFSGVNCSSTAPNAGLLNPGTSTAYTVEAWVYVTSASAFNSGMFGIAHPTAYVECGHSGASRWLYANTVEFGDQFNGFSGSVAIPSSTWTHVAVVREAGSSKTPRVYIAGNYAGAFNAPHSLGTGQHSAGAGWWRDVSNSVGTFYMEDLRITLNVERYTGTGSYTVPIAAF